MDSRLGAEVTGVDVRDLGEPAWRALEGAFNDYAVLVLPGQHLAADEQRRFAARFGPISTSQATGSSRSLPRSGLDHGAFNVANLSETGDLLDDADHEWNRALAGNFEWHTDSSYLPVSAQASMLTAHVVPSAGGETEWADMRAAWDSLPRRLRSRVEGRRAFHSFQYAQSRLQGGAAPDVDYRVGAPLRPLVKQHPVTGRSALYIGRHAFGIKGLPDRESEELLWELHELACRPPRLYRHEWQVGDLVIWDNRSVLHRGRPWDFSELRHLVHSRVAGDPLTEGAVVPYGSDAPSSDGVERTLGDT
ncbi:MAG TPA: TauD/TfdA family dioxygenase [Acidimicrobiales bacterium]|jgi:alpha-ketoglutarate-dependent taurine dioxygenase|nr:TauD/TfdA family dioxygenase [Acidimicrobiales bacterium]